MTDLQFAEQEVQTALDYFGSMGEDRDVLLHKKRYFENALKIFRMLREDDLAYNTKLLALSTTQQLLDREPLSPIEDVPGVWGEVYNVGGIKSCRCKRLPTLYKHVYPDGHIEYIDPSIYCCVTPRSDRQFKNGVIESHFLSEYCQVKMPYTQPEKPYIFTVEQFEAQWADEYLNLIAVLSVENPDGDKKAINRWLERTGDGWIEIGKETVVKLLDKYVKNARNWRNRLLGRPDYEN